MGTLRASAKRGGKGDRCEMQNDITDDPGKHWHFKKLYNIFRERSVEIWLIEDQISPFD